jgi:ubiquinone/menaquinone biosynthesis C-methylase UbiE
MNQLFKDPIADLYTHYCEKYVSIIEPLLAPIAQEIARISGLTKEQTALDLATGTGLIARTLRGFSRSIIGADISMGMLRLVYRECKGEIYFVAADAHKLPFKDYCFDLVTCGFGVSHFSDIVSALEEVHRILRPGGRFIVSAWGMKGENPSNNAAAEVRRKYLTDLNITFGCTINEELWADVTQASEVLRRTRFENVRVTTSLLSGQYQDHSKAIETILAWPTTRYQIAQLTPEKQEKFRKEIAYVVRKVSDLSWSSLIHYYEATRPVDG